MKNFIILVVLLGFSSVAYADGGPVGLGIVGEDPSGLTLKYKLNQPESLDFRLGLDSFNNGFLLVQGNYLVNLFYLAKGDDFDLPFYIGGGATFFFFPLGNNVEGLQIAARMPIGFDLEFGSSHLDTFVEIAPQLLFGPGVFAVVDGAVGIRYFF